MIVASAGRKRPVRISRRAVGRTLGIGVYYRSSVPAYRTIVLGEMMIEEGSSGMFEQPEERRAGHPGLADLYWDLDRRGKKICVFTSLGFTQDEIAGKFGMSRSNLCSEITKIVREASRRFSFYSHGDNKRVLQAIYNAAMPAPGSTEGWQDGTEP